MSNLYLTADTLSTPTGGGTVTANECAALQTLGLCEVISRKELGDCSDPWGWDEKAYQIIGATTPDPSPFKLCHAYAGTFGRSIDLLKRMDTRICVTIAAHDRAVSKREHEELGLPFPYPHLVQEDLWQRYIAGYAMADVIVCPSTVAARTVRDYGPEFVEKRIEIIPHGCTLPENIAPLPLRFTVGYLGAIGPDKGLRYLLAAWKKLAYKDATLVLAGRETTSLFMRQLISRFGGGNVEIRGEIKNVSDFYNSISLLVQPSATEGFGCTVLEAMAHGRGVLCSLGAGASDCVPLLGNCFASCNTDEIVKAIEWYRSESDDIRDPEFYLMEARERTWDKVREQYVKLWKELLV